MSAPTLDWRYMRDEDDREVSVATRNGVRFRVVPYHDNSGACVQRWDGGAWRTLRTTPNPKKPNRSLAARSWKSFGAALRAVERGDCDPPAAQAPSQDRR